MAFPSTCFHLVIFISRLPEAWWKKWCLWLLPMVSFFTFANRLHSWYFWAAIPCPCLGIRVCRSSIDVTTYSFRKRRWTSFIWRKIILNSCFDAKALATSLSLAFQLKIVGSALMCSESRKNFIPFWVALDCRWRMYPYRKGPISANCSPTDCSPGASEFLIEFAIVFIKWRFSMAVDRGLELPGCPLYLTTRIQSTVITRRGLCKRLCHEIPLLLPL